MELKKEQKMKFARIMFNSQGYEKKQIDQLTQDELEKIRSIYAQKIAFQSVNGKIPVYYNDQLDQQPIGPQVPSIMSSVCCCCYPEDYFDLTSTVFFERFFYSLLFWNNGFFTINNGKPEKYGLIWMIITYVIILGLASSLNTYFWEPQNYGYDNTVMMTALGMVIIFKVGEPLIYSGAIGCLGGHILSSESLMLSSYSLVLYFVPTLFCIVPSLYWHIMCQAFGSLFRAIFLFRNYSTRMESKTYIILLVIFIIEAIYLFLVVRVMFSTDLGYDFENGLTAVFGSSPDVDPEISTQAQNSHNILSFQSLRSFAN